MPVLSVPGRNGRVNKVDRHPDRAAIIQALIARQPRSAIASRYGLHPSDLHRYWDKYLGPTLRVNDVPLNNNRQDDKVTVNDSLVNKVVESAQSASTLSFVERKLSRYDRILSQAESDGDVRAWAQVDRAETAALELRSRLKGETQTTTSAPQVVVLFAESGHQRLDLGAGQVIDPEA